jgi:hypothetical protein
LFVNKKEKEREREREREERKKRERREIYLNIDYVISKQSKVKYIYCNQCTFKEKLFCNV